MFLLNIWKLSETQSYIVIGLAVVAVLCLIGIIVLSVKDKKNDKAKKDDSKEALESANNDIEKIEDKESSSEILNKDDDKEIIEPTNDSAQDSTLEEEADSNAASEEKTVSEDSVDNKQEEKFIDDSLVDPDSKQEESIIADDNKNIAKTVVKKDTFIKVNYLKSFRAKLSMSNDETREFYRIIKSHCLKYGLKSRMSWACETIYKGRVAYAKLTIRGKNLNVNLALNPADFENTKYYFKDTSDSKKYAMVPMRVKVKSSRGLKYVLELIDIMMNNNGLKKIPTYENVNTAEQVRSFDENLSLGLIKKINGRKASLEEIEEERIINDIPDTSVDSASANGDSDELVIDDEIMEMVTEIISTHKRVGKKGIINLDDIDRNFEENELVSVKSLKEKKLISSNIGQVKCLSRGKLTKPLIFELDDYSIPAIKTILFAGGEIR